MENFAEINDICAMDILDDSRILSCLKTRYRMKSIYTYTSKILIAINPYETFPELYGHQQINDYTGKRFGDLSPHIYAIVNEAVENMKFTKRNQSLLITGVSGSGKTNTAKHAIDFLSFTNISSTEAAEKSSVILEAFGNARTHMNSNSSRFCKFIELGYDLDLRRTATKIFFHFLESSRVIAAHSNEFNFHIFYKLVLGAPKNIKHTIYLDESKSFYYLPHIEMYRQSCYTTGDFETIDGNLDTFGLSIEKKFVIYSVLGAILNLGNIRFETLDSDVEKCYIPNDSQEILNNVAVLLRVCKVELEDVLTHRTILVANSKIRTPRTKCAAENVRNSLAKGLFENLFREIVRCMNEYNSSSSSAMYSIGILDIAGFEFLSNKNNSFDQLCINYINERFQQYFVDIMLLPEKKWYDSQGLDIPFVPFLDNTHIIDLFHHKPRGIFSILNDECKFQKPSMQNFAGNLKNAWENNKFSITWNLHGKKDNTIFLIHHFSSDVRYSTEDFIEKNVDDIPCQIRLIIQKSLRLIESNTETKVERKTRTSSSALKFEVDDLIKKLKMTNSHFIRCIKPNNEERSRIFDEELVLQQLNTSSTTSYAQLMRSGFPKRITLEELVNVCQPIEKKFQSFQGPNLYSKILLSRGFRQNDFRIGREVIFFRSAKFSLLEKLFHDMRESPDDTSKQISGALARSMWRCTIARISFLVAVQRRDTKDEPALRMEEIGDRVAENEPFQTYDESKIEESKQETKVYQKANVMERKPTNSKRYDQHNHFPLTSKKEVRCKNEGCDKKDVVFCQKCGVHLCLMIRRNCFTNYHLLNEMPQKKNQRLEEMPAHSIRFDERSHFPLITSKPARCKNEQCRKATRFYCQKCEVHLCLVKDRNCFTKFHSLSMEETRNE